MKRSSNITLVVMGTLAFTASFAGGSAFLAWQKPTQPQNCTTTAAGPQGCPTPRSSTGFAHYFHWFPASYYERTANAAPARQLADSRSRMASGAATTGAGGIDAASRGGFGASGRMAFRGSAAG